MIPLVMRISFFSRLRQDAPRGSKRNFTSVMGAHIIGPRSADMIVECVIAMEFRLTVHLPSGYRKYRP